jgi:ABC-2 type transport system permease protein
MMGNLIKAEFRKTLTLKTWWVLLIPLVVLGFGFSYVWGLLTNNFVTYIGSSDADLVFQRAGIDVSKLPVGLLSISHGVNIAMLIPALFGVFALAGEYRNKTITTTFLTAPNRLSALSAKMITYVVWGAIYGVVSFAVAALATISSVDGSHLPDTAQWLAAFGGTILASVLVTLFGVGFGAVLNKVTLAVVLLLVYFLIIENTLTLVLWTHTTLLGAILPNGTANGIVGGIAASAFGFNTLNLPPDLSVGAQYLLQQAAGAPGVVSWWASALVFAAWTAVFFGGGWAANQRRDIT